MATFLLVTAASMEKILQLLRKVLCIYYPFQVQKNLRKTSALIDLSSKVNARILAYAAKLSLKVWKTDIKTEKIDGSTLNILGIVLANF